MHTAMLVVLIYILLGLVFAAVMDQIWKKTGLSDGIESIHEGAIITLAWPVFALILLLNKGEG